MGHNKEQPPTYDFHVSSSELPSYDSIFHDENHDTLHTSQCPHMEINNVLLPSQHLQCNVGQMNSENKRNSNKIAWQRWFLPNVHLICLPLLKSPCLHQSISAIFHPVKSRVPASAVPSLLFCCVSGLDILNLHCSFSACPLSPFFWLL
jgi:hypothetical protein